MLFLNKLLELKISTLLIYLVCLEVVVTLIRLSASCNYKHLSIPEIHAELLKTVNPRLVPKKDRPVCQYEEILLRSEVTQVDDIVKKFDDFSAVGIINGSHVPEQCNPQFSVALLVTYRNRQSQLDIFLPYMHNFLRRQNLHYKIYVIEQQDEKPFNKGMLYNIGAKHAISDGFPCLILHDVDLLPLAESNLYACLKQPHHLSGIIDKFRFVLPYTHLVGGVLAISSAQYMQVNGISNKYEDWGGEDDDFAAKLTENNFKILRFAPAMSIYTMLVHHHQPINSKRNRILKENSLHLDKDSDGFRSIHYESMKVINHRLFTMIRVRL